MSYDVAFDDAFARLSAGAEGKPKGSLCEGDLFPKRRLRNSPEYGNEVVLGGPFDGNADEFKDFEDKLIKDTTNGAMTWMCGDTLKEYAKHTEGLFGKINKKRDRFGLYRATISATQSGTTCDQVIAFILYRDTTIDKTRFVHVDLICRGDRVDDESTKRAFVPGSALHQYMQDTVVVESTSTDGVDRVQFSLDSVETAIPIYEKWGYSTLRFNRKEGRVENKTLNATPMVKVFEREDGAESRFVLVDRATRAFKLSMTEKRVNFVDSVYGKVDVVVLK